MLLMCSLTVPGATPSRPAISRFVRPAAMRSTISSWRDVNVDISNVCCMVDSSIHTDRGARCTGHGTVVRANSNIQTASPASDTSKVSMIFNAWPGTPALSEGDPGTRRHSGLHIVPVSGGIA
jgi:hypothetical protein